MRREQDFTTTELARLPIKSWPIKLEDVVRVTIGGASWANGEGGSTQGGYL